MYLKRIEAQGFKSFANKTVLEFGPGIMGIVGPNGSGKSNVADAVRWVLGEQSARSLRGSNMQDVIFAGTENRRPLGFASVSLTIDNGDHLLAADYDEVTVGRRVYRSGESEYLLNGRNCRLRDIQELFYDTGVGREGYSIIGQGQIDRILSGRPEDRRDLFDEAAGIVRYKRRKQLTERKLETEEGNLARVTDSLNLLEKQVGPLERQAEKARRYLRLRDGLKQADIRSFCLESEEDGRRLRETKENLSIVDSDRERTEQDAGRRKAEADRLSEQQRELEERMTDLRSALGQKQVEQEKRQGQIRILEEQIQSARNGGDQARERISSLREEAGGKEEQRAALAAEQEELEEQRAEKEREQDALAVSLGSCQSAIRRWETHLEESQRQQMELLEKKAELTASRERCGTLISQAEMQRKKLEDDAAHAGGREEKLQAQISQLSGTLAEWESEEESQRTALKRAAESLRTAEQEQRQRSAELSELTQRFQALRSQRDSLVNLTERYEGYGTSIRKVMEKKGEVPGIRGVVADLFHTEKRYETALETALGGRIQNIVTDTEQTARELIDFLKKNRLGRATFLPLSAVKGRDRFPRPEALREPGALGVASDLVETGEEYQGIAAYLLGRVLVADDIGHALAIAAKYRYSLSIVTLEGEQLSPGGAMTGGSYRNSSNLLGRRREIRELEKSIAQTRRKRDACGKELAAAGKRVADTRQEQAELQQDVHRLELERNTISMDLARVREQAETLRKDREDRDGERRGLDARVERWTAEEAEIAGKLRELDGKLAGLSDGGSADNDRLSGLRSRLEELTQRAASLRQDTAALVQREGFLGENRNRLAAERENLLREAEKLEQSLADGESQIEERQRSIAGIRKEIEKESASCGELGRNLEERTAEREALSARRQELDAEREECAARLSGLTRESCRLQNQEERLEEQVRKRVDYLWDEYGMTPSEAEQFPASDDSLAECRKKAAELKAEIRDLGPVNVHAVEEYREVSGQYEFLKGQHGDLVKAADSLRKIIRDLERGMRSQFTEKFAEIQAEFGRVFRELFGGGRGELSLAESEDVLEAGILINAQPPGKKLQNMMQLSGGEKALTAIALLFAIQNLKPSPFCLLDEIEAALDEPNVDRYAGYLNRLKGHTQFIVITHRRGTMEIAERLYGITMQEKGVSALVSVDLTDEALDELTKGE